MNSIILSCASTQKMQRESEPTDDPSGAVDILVDLNREVGEMSPMWAYFGYDEPNYTYMKNGRKLLTEISELSPVPVHVRAHNLLTTDEGPRASLKWGSTNAYTEDDQGNPVYNWTIVDKIIDTYVDRGMKPMVEIGFMPKALSTNPEPYRHGWAPAQAYRSIYTGWSYPPEDYKKWAKLIYQWVRHSVDRYGKEEINTWWWDVWNEPDAGYWQGTKKEYFKLYDYTADAVKRALPTAKVGGPTMHSAGRSEKAGEYFKDFLEHCRSGTNYATGEVGAPLDYISFHAKGRPVVVGDGDHVQMSMSQQLKEIEPGFSLIASFPEFKKLPVILGETDPEGCAACSVEYHPENAYRNGTMYSSYTAASFARMYEMADRYGINFEGAVTWAFEFENEPWFAGFRSLTTHGVDKPVLNVFRMFGMMGGERVGVSNAAEITVNEIIDHGVRGNQPDINALASRKDNVASVMVWNYHDDDVYAPASEVSINIEGIPADKVLLRHYRIDGHHSNAYTVWRQMGTPQQVTSEQYEKLEDAGSLELMTSPEWVKASNREASIRFMLPRQGVSLLQITWE